MGKNKKHGRKMPNLINTMTQPLQLIYPTSGLHIGVISGQMRAQSTLRKIIYKFNKKA